MYLVLISPHFRLDDHLELARKEIFFSFVPGSSIFESVPAFLEICGFFCVLEMWECIVTAVRSSHGGALPISCI